MKSVFLAICLSRVFFVLIALVSFLLVPLNEGYLGKQFLPDAPYLAWIWANFDGRHFLDIASSGYQNFNFAYFPLYPLLIKVLGYLLRLNYLYVGIAISLVAFFIAAYVVYKIVLLDYPKKVALWTVIFLCFFPLSFFYHSVYADALFLLLATLSLYFARLGGQSDLSVLDRKKKWFLAGVFLTLAISTRLSGLALAPAIAWELIFSRQANKRNLLRNIVRWGVVSVFLGLVGLAPYLIYLEFIYGDWLLFQKSMVAWGQSGFVLLPQVLYRYIRILTMVDMRLLVYWIAVIELVTFLLYLFLTWYVWKNIRQSYALFMFLLLIMVTFTGTLAGTPRYILHLFPGFLALALLIANRSNDLLKRSAIANRENHGRKPVDEAEETTAVRPWSFISKRTARYLFVAVLVILGVLFTSLFTRGYFVT